MIDLYLLKITIWLFNAPLLPDKKKITFICSRIKKKKTISEYKIKYCWKYTVRLVKVLQWQYDIDTCTKLRIYQ